MNIFKLAFKNLTRRRGRFIFTLLGITVGMASFVALISLSGNLRSEITREAGALGADLIVMPKNWCVYDQISILTGESLPESIPQSVVDKIAAIDGIEISPYLTEKTAIQNNPVLLIGIIPDRMMEHKDWEMRAGVYLDTPDERAVVVGADIAEQFGLGTGGSLTVRGEVFPIKGVIEPTGGNDDVSVFMPLSVAQEIYRVDGYVSFIAVKVDDVSKTEAYIAAIVDAANVAVSTDGQLLGSVLGIIGSVNVTMQLVAGTALIAAAFGIINTMMSAIYERRREIGIMRAIGGRSGVIFTLFLMESGMYGLLGGILGIITGTAVSRVIAPLISQNEFTALLRGSGAGNPGAAVIAGTLAFSVAAAVAAGAYPAWKAARIAPVEAISYGG